MRRRVVDHIPAHEAERQLKLGLGRAARRRVRRPAAPARARPRRRAGPGADHAERAGRADPGGYVGREDGEALHEAYAFLRTLEHRIQLHQLRRTHVVPEDEDCAAPARPVAGLHQGPGRGASTRPGSTTGARCAGCTRSSSTGRCSPRSRRSPGSEARLSPEAAEQRLAALGFARPEGRAAPPRGAHHRRVPRPPQIQRTLLPVHARAGSPTRPTRTPACSGSAGSASRSGRHAVVPHHAARRGPGGRAAGPAAGHLPLRHRPAGARAAGRADARRTT